MFLDIEIEKPKTLTEWKNNGGNLWAVPFNGGGTGPMVESVHEAIEEYFSDRRIGVMSDQRFQRIWNSYLRKYEYPFFQMLEGESTFQKYASMIASYERSRTHTDTHSETVDGNNTNNITSTGKNSIKGTTDYTANNTVTANDTGTSESTNNGTHKGKNDTKTNARTLSSDTPQSNVASSTTGLDTPITWMYATNLSDAMNNTVVTDESTDTSTNNTSTTNESNSTSNDTNKTTSTNTGTSEGTTKTDGTAHSSTTGNSEGTEKETGTNSPVSDILKSWKSFLFETPSSLNWLFRKMEPLFYPFYD